MIVGLRTAIRWIRTTGRRRRLRAWGALAVVLGVGLGWVPLFGVLGFELATATALFAAIMGLDVGSALARVTQRRPPGPGAAPPAPDRRPRAPRPRRCCAPPCAPPARRPRSPPSPRWSPWSAACGSRPAT